MKETGDRGIRKGRDNSKEMKEGRKKKTYNRCLQGMQRKLREECKREKGGKEEGS